ncbi:MAG: hypothetical protein L0241_16875 [Planctomycetia bacterium]|nr:hypothetical protein [Planctomycetia bacterium]
MRTGDRRKVRLANLLELLAMLFLSVVVIVPAFYVVILGRFWVAQIPFELAVGWAQYLLRVLSQVNADVWAVASAVACFAAVIVGTHFTVRWLLAASDRRWPWKRTLQVVALLVVMFASGLAFTGLIQQTGWLIRTPEPLVKDNRSIQ